ncbi:MAG: helix-turn-helix domain-containing protein [Candidatus Acidiferrales bacterium]
MSPDKSKPSNIKTTLLVRRASRYTIAETMGISLDSLRSFERDVYEKFVIRILEIIERPEWGLYDRYSDDIDLWVSEFCVAYQQALQFAIAELSELLARSVMVNYRKGRPLDAERILRISFLFAEELTDPDFAKIWLAFVAGRTKGPEISKVSVPIGVGTDIFCIRRPTDADYLFMPDPDKIGMEISGCFLREMINPTWKDWARRAAVLKIDVCARLAPKEAGTGRPSPIEMPLPAWDKIKGRPSLSAQEAADILHVSTRTIRNYLRAGKLDRSAKGRVTNNEKFEREYDRTHSPKDASKTE